MQEYEVRMRKPTMQKCAIIKSDLMDLLTGFISMTYEQKSIFSSGLREARIAVRPVGWSANAPSKAQLNIMSFHSSLIPETAQRVIIFTTEESS